MLTDWEYAKAIAAYVFVRPVKLYFNAEFREQWLREMIDEGQKKHILTKEDADVILSQIHEPFIQKYLQCLAVHVCTLPVTQLVSVSVAIIYLWLHPELSWAEATVIATAILVFFQIIPISPGSFVRGAYVVYLVIKERNFKDYNIAIFLGFFKYIGYLAFPIQMAYRYPHLARFMAGHWATEAAHIVPIFGEHGALLEHKVFNIFYNWPLTVRRCMRNRIQMRLQFQPRYWHLFLWGIVGAIVLGLAEYSYAQTYQISLPALSEIWYLVILLPMLIGTAITVGCAGAALNRRVLAGFLGGVWMAVLSIFFLFLCYDAGNITLSSVAISASWRLFFFSFLGSIGVMLTELLLPDPYLLKAKANRDKPSK